MREIKFRGKRIGNGGQKLQGYENYLYGQEEAND